MPQKRQPLRIRLAAALAGTSSKAFIPALDPAAGAGFASVRLQDYTRKPEQLAANLGWVFTANNAIAEPCAAVNLKLFKKQKNGEREEIFEHELLNLLDGPNAVHTGEQMRQLHFTYMNLIGEGYLLMTGLDGKPFKPVKGKLPVALQTLPAHEVQFELGETYSSSIVKWGNNKYPVTSVIRDINPDPMRPYFGRSIVAAAAQTIDTEHQMKEWNRRFFANNARPSLIFSTANPLDNDAYERWKQQFDSDHAGTENAYKPLLIEGGTATPWGVTQNDLDFLDSRKFSRDEILAMFRVSPGVVGSVENVNRSSMDASFYNNAMINVLPRVRQFVRQLNETLVKVYDDTLELDFENPVPEDIEAKLKQAEAGVDKWWTKDEVRAMYGDEELPDGVGEHIIVTAKGGAITLEDVVAGNANPDKPSDDPLDPDDDDDDPTGDEDDTKKAHSGVKKKP